ncbi:nicotinate-nucleotide--dimethylbenzimidazole phosphoribosyltransferase, partial [Anaerosinus sp.]
MDLLKSTIAKVTPLNDLAMAKIKKASHNLITPEGCLGYLETILQKYVGITNEITPSVPKKCMVVACADHGVAEEGVSAYPVETTVQMTRNYLVAKGAGANAMALHCGADLVVVDVGIAAPMEKIEGLIDRKINYGTKNFTKGPAMTESEAIRSLEIGIEIATQKIAEGYRCFCLGEMGIANTTSSAAIVAAFAKLAPKKATGRGTNISDERLLKK